MKVLIVNTYYYPNIIGGTEVSIKKLAEGLVKKGLDVYILCSNIEDKIEFINEVKVHRLKLENIYQPIELRGASAIKKVIGRANDIYNKFNEKKIDSLIKEINPDVIHVNNIYGISPVIWKIAKKNNIKVIHTIRDYYLMCPKISMLKKGKLCDNKNVFCKLFGNINKRASIDVDIVTAPSKCTLDLFIKEGFFKNAEHKKIFNAIDFDIIKVKELLDLKISNLNKKKNIKFVFIGTLTKNKGLDLLLYAFSEIKDDNIQLTIAGKGNLLNLVNEYVEKDKRISYRGFVKEEEVNRILKEGDVLIAPSIWNEPFGRVVLDAYKNVMPVIAGNYGGLREIVKDGLTGKLIEPKDKQEFKKAINYLSNRDNIKNMLSNCVEELKNYSIEKQVEEFIDIYK